MRRGTKSLAHGVLPNVPGDRFNGLLLTHDVIVEVRLPETNAHFPFCFERGDLLEERSKSHHVTIVSRTLKKDMQMVWHHAPCIQNVGIRQRQLAQPSLDPFRMRSRRIYRPPILAAKCKKIDATSTVMRHRKADALSLERHARIIAANAFRATSFTQLIEHASRQCAGQRMAIVHRGAEMLAP